MKHFAVLALLLPLGLAGLVRREPSLTKEGAKAHEHKAGPFVEDSRENTDKYAKKVCEKEAADKPGIYEPCLQAVHDCYFIESRQQQNTYQFNHECYNEKIDQSNSVNPKGDKNDDEEKLRKGGKEDISRR